MLEQSKWYFQDQQVPWEKGLKYLLKVWKVGRSFPELVAAADLQFSRSLKEGGGGSNPS
jgi:hypothetical protein